MRISLVHHEQAKLKIKRRRSPLTLLNLVAGQISRELKGRQLTYGGLVFEIGDVGIEVIQMIVAGVKVIAMAVQEEVLKGSANRGEGIGPFT